MEDLQDYAFGQWLKSRHLQKNMFGMKMIKEGKITQNTIIL